MVVGSDMPARRLSLLGADAQSFTTPLAVSVASAARNGGYSVIRATTGGDADSASLDGAQPWGLAIDLMVALDADSAITGRARLARDCPGMASLLVIDTDTEPSDRLSRAARMVDLLLTPRPRHPAVRRISLRPAVLEWPSGDREWRAAFDRAVSHRKKVMGDAAP